MQQEPCTRRNHAAGRRAAIELSCAKGAAEASHNGSARSTQHTPPAAAHWGPSPTPPTQPNPSLHTYNPSHRYLFKRALQANPRSRYTHLAWAIWERRQGNMQQALQLLARGQALNPADPAIYQAWGLLEREAGRYDEARRLFKLGLQVRRPWGPCMANCMWGVGAWRLLLPPPLLLPLLLLPLLLLPLRLHMCAQGCHAKGKGVPSCSARKCMPTTHLPLAPPAPPHLCPPSLWQADSTHLYLWQAWGCLEFALGRYDEARARFQDGVWADPGNKDVVYVFQVRACPCVCL